MSNFHVEQDEMVKFVGEMDHRIMQYVEVVEDIKAAFKAICSTEGFEGNRANAAKEYCSIHYGDTEEKFVWKITKTIDDDYYKLSKD